MKNAKSDHVRLLITGGHAATTALATVAEIKKRYGNWKIYFAGSKFAIEGKDTPTLESEVLPKEGVKFLPLTSGRLQRKFTIWTIPSILKIPVGFIQSLIYLIKIRPDVVLSFGGYASFGITFWSYILRIPVILHEQTAAAGRASLVTSRFAKIIAISRPSSAKYFPGRRIILTGNPTMAELFKTAPREKTHSRPVLFIVGGSRGSQTINSVIESSLSGLLANFDLIHITGELDYSRIKELREVLPEALRDHYEIFARVDPYEMVKFYDKSDIVISRAGANTVSEIIAAHRPAILIPLRISYKDEQLENAKMAESLGNAEIIIQNNLTETLLLEKIDDIIRRYSSISAKIADERSPDEGAAEKLVEIITRYI